jgi:DNA-binding GntR family transcriptional regulator
MIVDNHARTTTSKVKSPRRHRGEPSSLVEKVRSRLQDLILSGEIAPGERLKELELAARFRVSRGPLREAIRALELTRLVTTLPNCGARVSCIDLQGVLELYDVRAGLARSAGRLFAVRATTVQISVLQKLHDRMCRAVNAAAATFYTANLRFHDLIFEFAGNTRLREIDQAVRKELQLFIRHGSLGDAQLRVSNAEHAAFLKAVRAGDAQEAGRILEQHVLNGRQRMLENLHQMKPCRRMKEETND